MEITQVEIYVEQYINKMDLDRYDFLYLGKERFIDVNAELVDMYYWVDPIFDYVDDYFGYRLKKDTSQLVWANKIKKRKLPDMYTPEIEHLLKSSEKPVEPVKKIKTEHVNPIVQKIEKPKFHDSHYLQKKIFCKDIGDNKSLITITGFVKVIIGLKSAYWQLLKVIGENEKLQSVKISGININLSDPLPDLKQMYNRVGYISKVPMDCTYIC